MGMEKAPSRGVHMLAGFLDGEKAPKHFVLKYFGAIMWGLRILD